MAVNVRGKNAIATKNPQISSMTVLGESFSPNMRSADSHKKTPIAHNASVITE
jgi:hypothetical protein